MTTNNTKPSSWYIKAEAAARYQQAEELIKSAEARRDPLRAMASQTQASFGKVLDALATICKALEDQEEQIKDVVERLKRLEHSRFMAGGPGA